MGNGGKTMIQGKTMTVAPLQHIVHQPALPLDKIVLGDNCEVMRTLPSESIDLVVTSPPYDDLRTYGGHDWDFYGVAWNLKRLLKPGGVIVWIVGDRVIDGSETLSSMAQAMHFKSIGLRLHDTMIYQKEIYLPKNDDRYEQAFEYSFVISKGKPRAFNAIKQPCLKAGQMRQSSTQREKDGTVSTLHGDGKAYKDEKPLPNVWSYRVGNNHSTKDKSAFEHPATFPEALARDHILSWSNEGDIVLDPFSGSGTTAKMAKHNGRRFIGIEVNPEYVEIAEKRLMQQVLF